MTLLAHKDADGGVQTLRDHLHNAGDLAESYESEFSQIPRMAALLHDVGKVAQQFQTYLISGKGRRGEIPHARQGAFVVNDLPISNSAAEIVKEILELVIAKHHGELPDCINEIGDEAFLTGFTEADKQNPKYAYGEIKQGLHDLDLDLQDTFQQAEKDVFDFAGRTKLLKLSKDSRYFYSGLLVKYVYSRLIDADRTDTAYFETKEQYHPIKADWSELIRRLDESMKSFDSTSEINKIRQQITEQCRQAGSRETGIYRLSVPTGGGKTLASLNFALHHALETGKRRIIYVIPYLSITSQTVATFRNMLGLDADSNIVLEHYSTAGLQNSGNTGSIGTSEEEDAKERQRKLASERWDNPIIVTTMVEFLETVMSARGTKLTVDELRGVEGLAAKDYFYAFDDLVLKNKDDFFFTNRSRRPPLDRLNALLSFCYSILTNDCIAALQGVGLDPYVGFMHTDRPGRASLALDLVEEFRPVLADRFVLTLVNTGAVKPGDFEIRENGGVLLSDSGRKKVLTAWQKKKSDQILHPFLQEKISWGLVPYVQALLLARSLRGDLDDYPPFMWK